MVSLSLLVGVVVLAYTAVFLFYPKNLRSKQVQSSIIYEYKHLKAPRLRGIALRICVFLIEFPITSWILGLYCRYENQIDKIHEQDHEDLKQYAPLTHPQFTYDDKYLKEEEEEAAAATFGQQPNLSAINEELCELENTILPPEGGFKFETVADFYYAYKNKLTTPEDVAKALIKGVRESNAGSAPLRAVIDMLEEDVMKQAKASTQRWAQGAPLSVFDGVPVAVKDEIDQVPYKTNVGTKFLGTRPAAEDATVVKRFRDAGALLFAKTNMREIGISTITLNLHEQHGVVRNPYNMKYSPGGSSSGSAAAVAVGLCPVAIGADGGGSIRVPASFCGLVGLKCTLGRVSENGAFPLCWSVAHAGPIAATGIDCAMAYSLMAGKDDKDSLTMRQPPVHLGGLEKMLRQEGGDKFLNGLRIGVYWKWFNDASPTVVESCTNMLNEYKQRGAEIVPIEIPNLSVASLAHKIIIISEMAAAIDAFYPKHRTDFLLETRFALGVARTLSNVDYIQSQRIKMRAVKEFLQALDNVDVIATPTTADTSPVIDDSVIAAGGDFDLNSLSKSMFFVVFGNLTGLPCITYPVGYEQSTNLPIGLHLMAKPWKEALLLKFACVSDQIVKKSKPQQHIPVLAQARLSSSSL